jgi:hypothetical protein
MLFLLIAFFLNNPATANPNLLTPVSHKAEIVYDTTGHKTWADTIASLLAARDTVRVPDGPVVSLKDFGAAGDGKHDDIEALEHARDWLIHHPGVLTIPVGDYFISRPFVLQNLVNGQYRFFTIHLKGLLPNKSASLEYLSRLICGYKSGFGIGIQLGRGITIENITILGMYTFPNHVTNANIGTLKYSDWADGSVTDSRNNPYAGIVIDPYTNKNGSQGGTSDVTIKNCSIRQWMVGVCLTPNSGTANDEIVNIIDDDIETCRVAIAIGQDQSKTIKISGLKVWASTHTILDGLNYGRGTGGGSVFCDNWNIAGNVNQLFNIVNDRFPLSAINIYSESIFKIGTVGGSAGVNLINCQIDFLTGPGMPAADYLIHGGASFYGGCLRYYDGSMTHRMNLSNTSGIYRDMVLSNAPILCGLYGIPQNVYPLPIFENVHLYYPGKNYKKDSDTLIKLPAVPMIHIDRIKWVAAYKRFGMEKVGDYILGAGRGCFDREMAPNGCNTIQIGRVASIKGDSVYLDDVAVNVYEGNAYDRIYINRLK